MITLRPPGSHAMGQALVDPNPSPNHLGASPSAERHARPHAAPKFNSDLAHNVQVYEGGHGAKTNPLARGFMHRGAVRLENPRHPSEHPTIGAGRSAPNPHQEHQRKFAEMRKDERQGAVQAHMKSPGFHPPHAMHPDTVKAHSQTRPKLGKPSAFGARSMVAASRQAPNALMSKGMLPGGRPITRQAPNAMAGKETHQAPTNRPSLGAKPTAIPSAGAMMKSGGGVLSLVPHKAAPKLMPQATKAAIGLPTFHGKTAAPGRPKPQPARPIVSAPAVNHTLKVTPKPSVKGAPKLPPKPFMGHLLKKF